MKQFTIEMSDHDALVVRDALAHQSNLTAKRKRTPLSVRAITRATLRHAIDQLDAQREKLEDQPSTQGSDR